MVQVSLVVLSLLLQLVGADEQVGVDIDAGNATSLPTITVNRTASPSGAPTGPTELPSSSPSRRPSPLPSGSPTDLPTPSPTWTVAPSAPPSSSPHPSYRPSSSPRPSVSPAPSDAPSAATDAPSDAPSVSSRPTVSPRPTVTSAPSASFRPSNVPSFPPSETPSVLPTVSPAPSSVPTIYPSAFPTVSAQPSSQPSVSSAPTKSSPPSLVPSDAPTNFPSAPPSVSPTTLAPTATRSETPTATPTISLSCIPSFSPTSSPTRIVTQSEITMRLEGFQGTLSESQTGQWEQLTTDHMNSYFYELQKDIPDIVPVHVTSVVQTSFQRQQQVGTQQEKTGESNKESETTSPLLLIGYEQTIEVGVVNEVLDSDELTNFLFVSPFDYDGQDYVLSLIKKWDISDFITVKVHVGDETDGSSSDSGLSQRAVRSIAVAIVLAAVLIVVFLLWDRHRKETRLQERRNDTIEGNDSSWGNSHLAVSGAPATGAEGPNLLPPGAQDDVLRESFLSNTSTTARTESGTMSATTSSSVILPGSRSNHPIIPARNRAYSGGDNTSSATASNRRRSFSGGGSGLPPLPPTADGGRQTPMSYADTDSTEMTYSDAGMDTGSDMGGAPPVLPTITDEQDRFQSEAHPLSPLHIPDEEEQAIDLRNMVSPPASPPDSHNLMLGLAAVGDSSPSMSGFDMRIQDLE